MKQKKMNQSTSGSGSDDDDDLSSGPAEDYDDDGTGGRRKVQGGTRAAASTFVFVASGLENMGFVYNSVSLVIYLYKEMNMSLRDSATCVTNFLGTSYFLAIFAGLISDTCLTRFTTALLFAPFQFLGYGLLTAQAHYDQLRPSPCGPTAAAQGNQCEAADGGQRAILFTGLYLVALGNGGVKASLPLLGADQFERKEAAQLASYFNWLTFSVMAGSITGVTFLVWISSNKGWQWGFLICTLSTFIQMAILCSSKHFFRNNVPNGSPVLRILQVLVAALRNRHCPVPRAEDELYNGSTHDEDDHESREILQRSNQFRFLERAAIFRQRSGSGSPGAWKMCTVTQVEETKILIRMCPIILTTVFLNTCLAQLQTFSIQQSLTLDTRIGSFNIPGSSLPVIPITFNIIFIPVYDRLFVPLARRLTGIPTGIRYFHRIGVGLLLSALSMGVAGVFETKRKAFAVERGMVDSTAPLPISVFWLGFQFAIFGIADMFSLVGLLHFYYAESSEGMKSMSTAITNFSLGFGFFMSSAVVEVVNKVSGGWLGSNNLNRDRLNYFYWLLSGMSVVNFGFYLVAASWYRYKKVEDHRPTPVSARLPSSPPPPGKRVELIDA